MSEDLAERLRAVMDYSHTEIRFEAANEIERLESALGECRGDLESHKWAGDRVRAAEAKVAKLREALAFYADRETWKGQFLERPIDKDCDGDFVAVPGKRARQALTETEDKDNE